MPKNDFGENWHWKDLNNGVNVTFYGRIFHLYDCDKWTKVQKKATIINQDDEYVKFKGLSFRASLKARVSL